MCFVDLFKSKEKGKPSTRDKRELGPPLNVLLRELRGRCGAEGSCEGAAGRAAGGSCGGELRGHSIIHLSTE